MILDLLYFGLIYLIGLCFNFAFFKYNGQRNYFIGYLSLCLLIIGIGGYYFVLIPRLVAYQEMADVNIEIEIGFGFYFAIATCILIISELFYLRKKEGAQVYVEKSSDLEKEWKKKEKERIKKQEKKKLKEPSKIKGMFFKWFPFIITKPIFIILGILNLFIEWSSFPKGYDAIKPYIWILWMYVIIFIIGFILDLFYFGDNKIMRTIGYAGIVLLLAGLIGYLLSIWLLISSFPSVIIKIGYGLIFAIFMVLVATIIIAIATITVPNIFLTIR